MRASRDARRDRHGRRNGPGDAVAHLRAVLHDQGDGQRHGPRPAGTETILLVEDDEQVRTVARNILRASGYRVVEARDPEDALLQSAEHHGVIHLLFSDVVMPRMSGPALAKRLAATRPEMKVLCTSGYTDDSIVRHGVLEAHIAYLQKPLTPETLTAKVREVLDGGPAGAIEAPRG